VAAESLVDTAQLDPDMSVETIMRVFPAALPVMLRWRMLCVGCPVSGFHTLAEACAAHGHSESELRAELSRSIGGSPATSDRAPRPREGGGADR